MLDTVRVPPGAGGSAPRPAEEGRTGCTAKLCTVGYARAAHGKRTEWSQRPSAKASYAVFCALSCGGHRPSGTAAQNAKRPHYSRVQCFCVRVSHGQKTDRICEKRVDKRAQQSYACLLKKRAAFRHFCQPLRCKLSLKTVAGTPHPTHSYTC